MGTPTERLFEGAWQRPDPLTSGPKAGTQLHNSRHRPLRPGREGGTKD